MTPKAILTDIEGTTSSLSFVADVLFPYARARLADYCAANADQVAPILAEVQAMAPGDPIATLQRWIDEDQKITPLKTLQGMIWEGGFTSGAFKGHIYADAAAALHRWHNEGRALYIFSSGSIAAQKLIFGHSEAGDLTPLLSGYFDTNTGPKRDPASYGAIADAIGLPVADILFLSDVAAETDAAKAAGMPALLIDRSGGPADIHTFEDITL